MSDLGLLSSVHSNFEDYAALIDDVIMELESGNVGGPASIRLKRLIDGASNPAENSANLRAVVFVSLISGTPGTTPADLTDIAAEIATGELSDKALLKKLNSIAGHLERERASLAQRIGR